MIHIAPSTIEQVLALTCAIQQIPAPTFHEEKRAQFTMEEFQRLGLEEIQRDAAGNALGRLPCGRMPAVSGERRRQPLVISAHLDTVHPFGSALDLKRSRDRIAGRAVGDNSLGVAALLAIPALFKDRPELNNREIWLAANTGEEGLGDLRGMQAIVDRFGDRPAAYLVIEGMGLGNVLHRGLGVERYKVTARTAGGHSWVDYGQPSAVHELCRLVAELVDIPLPRRPATTFNVGVIHGGNSVNSIAAEAWCELDLRSEDAQALAGLVGSVHERVTAAARNSVQFTSEQIGKRLAGAIPEDHHLVKMACGVLRELGVEPRMDIASTDSNLPLSRGFPSICIGITHGYNAHTADEFILTEPVETGLLQLFEITARLCQLPY